MNRQRDFEIRLNAVEAGVASLCDGSEYRAGESVGLNGQSIRKTIFSELADAFGFDAVVETGTWLGDTTGYLATTLKVPVYSCELHRIPHLVAKKRLSNVPGVHLYQADSRSFLEQIRTVIGPDIRCLFYLDAHWHSDLPLAEELEIICGYWRHYVIAIDDFQVPGDDGYAYDSYGRGKSLSLNDFRAAFTAHNLVPFFPSRPAAEETGFKRGSVVLAPAGPIADRIRQLPSLCER